MWMMRRPGKISQQFGMLILEGFVGDQNCCKYQKSKNQRLIGIWYPFVYRFVIFLVASNPISVYHIKSILIRKILEYWIRKRNGEIEYIYLLNLVYFIIQKYSLDMLTWMFNKYGWIWKKHSLPYLYISFIYYHSHFLYHYQNLTDYMIEYMSDSLIIHFISI